MKKISRYFTLACLATFLCASAQLSFGQLPATGTNAQPVNPASYNHPVRVACLGDSITMGVGTTVPAKESYPAQLQTILGPKWEVTNFGVGGRTLLRKADPFSIGRALKSNADVVIIMLGTNDSRQKTWDKFGNDFESDYAGIIDQLSKLDTHPRIWICCPTPMFPGKWELSETILTSRTIPAIKDVAKAKSVALIDLHTPMLDQKANFADTVHPNAKAARRIAELVAGAIAGTTPTAAR